MRDLRVRLTLHAEVGGAFSIFSKMDTVQVLTAW